MFSNESKEYGAFDIVVFVRIVCVWQNIPNRHGKAWENGRVVWGLGAQFKIRETNKHYRNFFRCFQAYGNVLETKITR